MLQNRDFLSQKGKKLARNCDSMFSERLPVLPDRVFLARKAKKLTRNCDSMFSERLPVLPDRDSVFQKRHLVTPDQGSVIPDLYSQDGKNGKKNRNFFSFYQPAHFPIGKTIS